MHPELSGIIFQSNSKIQGMKIMSIEENDTNKHF
jgi:hypothetical protein